MEYQFQPHTFADKMIELEASLEYQGTLSLIRTLNDLYRGGIDYYMEKQPKKAKFLQKKMTSLLANPDNLRILEKAADKHAKQQPESAFSYKATHNSQQRQSRLNTKKLNDQVSKFHTVADSCIKNLVETTQKAVNKTDKLKKLDLNKQQTKLEDRIALKRLKSQDKTKNIPSQKNILLGDGFNRVKFEVELSK